VALALLGGSAVFSYVAWSDEVRAGLVRTAVPAPHRGTPTREVIRGEASALVHELRRENIALRERIARLERAIGAVADTGQAALGTP
jgi:hypothetical protein